MRSGVFEKFEDEDSDIYRIGALTEKSHLYLYGTDYKRSWTIKEKKLFEDQRKNLKRQFIGEKKKKTTFDYLPY